MTFQVEHFTLPSHYEETPLCDRKENLPNLYRDDEKAEFLRDVIALANSARSFGKPVRLLFGIDDHGKPADLGDYLAPYAAHISAGVQLPEKIREQIGKTLATYVKPELSKFDFELGECEGKCVAYLLIHPVPSAKRFRVARDLTSGKQRLLSMYRRLREREQQRDLLPPRRVERWWDKAGKLALKLDGRSPHCNFDTARQILGSQQALSWLLSLGVLDRLTRMAALTYRTEATKVYFAAAYLPPRANPVFDKAARRLFHAADLDFRERTRSMLEMITTDDLSSLTL